MKIQGDMKISVRLFALLAAFAIHTDGLFAASGDLNLVERYRIAEGCTYEEKVAQFKGYVTENAATIRNATWNVAMGMGMIEFELLRDGIWTANNARLTYQVPGTLTPGRKGSVSYLLTGDISNAQAHWNPDATWTGSLSISLWAGNNRESLAYVGKMNPEVYSTLSNKSVGGTFEFDVPSGVRYVAINVMIGTSILGGIGMGYLYEVDGVTKDDQAAMPGYPQNQPIPQDCKDSGTRFNSISGTVKVAPDAAAKAGSWGFARLETVLCVDDHVMTGEESECILSFADMSTFILKEETHIIINAPPDEAQPFTILYGKILANVRRMMKDGSMEIEMSQAVSAHKGTIFVCEEDGMTSTLKVLEGKVAFTSKASGETILVQGGQQVSADADGLSEVIALDVAAEAALWPTLDVGGGWSMPTVLVIAALVVLAGYSLMILLKYRKRRME